jgi:hypothetical protein
MRAIGSILILSLALSSCTSLRNSRVNPLNWFKPETSAGKKSLIPQESMLRRKPKVIYAGTPVHVINLATFEPTIDGKILRIAAQTASMGASDIRIETLDDQGDGVMRLVVKAVLPAGAPTGTDKNRAISAARFFSNQDLEKYKTFEVSGANNSIRLRS